MQSGWNNSYIMLKWLEDVFDPYIRGLARDGRDPDSFSSMVRKHTKVAFLEACWSRNIVVVIFPAHLTRRFQRLSMLTSSTI